MNIKLEKKCSETEKKQQQQKNTRKKIQQEIEASYIIMCIFIHSVHDSRSTRIIKK